MIMVRFYTGLAPYSDVAGLMGNCWTTHRACGLNNTVFGHEIPWIHLCLEANVRERSTRSSKCLV
jgi:hypothetical protein